MYAAPVSRVVVHDQVVVHVVVVHESVVVHVVGVVVVYQRGWPANDDEGLQNKYSIITQSTYYPK